MMVETDLRTERHWALDPELQPYFMAASIILVVCFVVGVLVNVFSWSDTVIPLQGWVLWVFGTLIGVGAASSALFLWLGMLSYWWQVCRESMERIGSCLVCFCWETGSGQ